MHRFRKRSDAKRQNVPSHSPPNPADLIVVDPDPLPEIPANNDFRTSLILPDLSRRFSLLRSQSGEPVPLHDLKSRLASQRARGARNHVSEEEENLILDTLSSIHSESHQSDFSSLDDTSSSPSRASGGRYGGRRNIFGGSARHQDFNYLRSVATQRSTSVVSSSDDNDTAPHQQQEDMLQSTNTPDSSPSHSAPSTPGDVGTFPRRATSPLDHPTSVAEYRLSKALGPSALKRASMAVQQAIQELEEEADDEIVLPRFSNVRKNGDCGQSGSDPDQSSVYLTYDEPGMAISSAHYSPPDSPRSSASPVPSQAKPGYIPGMPRPVTPHGMEGDELRAHSTTPRATSSHSYTNYGGQGEMFGRPSSPRSPGSSQSRSSNGRSSAAEDTKNKELFSSSSDLDLSFNAPTMGKRRPSSPLSSAPYQAMPLPSSSSRPGAPHQASAFSGSRPGTPSNVIWRSHSPKPSNSTTNGAWMHEVMYVPVVSHHGQHERNRSLRSPALPDSPIIEGGQSTNIFTSLYPAFSANMDNARAFSPEAIDLGSPILGTGRLRSPTPTQSDQRSSSPHVSSPTKGKKASRPSQHQPTPSSFSFGSLNPLSLVPLDDSSRSSIDSDGSSYHSHEGHNDVSSLFQASDSGVKPWHDLSSLDQTTANTSARSDSMFEAEDTIKRCSGGLTKADFYNIQEKLVTIAGTRRAALGRERTPSLRRARRPSTSQSNYSVNGADKMSPLGHRALSPSTSPVGVMQQEQDVRSKMRVDSPLSHRGQPSPTPMSIQTSNHPPALSEPSPTSRRNRDLAKALFGHDDDSSYEVPDHPRDDSQVKDSVHDFRQPSVPHTAPLQIPAIFQSSEPDEDPAPTSAPVIPSSSQYFLHRNASTPKIPHEDLAREIQMKTELAMDALRKSPSTTKLHELGGHPAQKKKITPKIIGNPQFVSSSASLDTVPLPVPAATSPVARSESKMSQRIKKLRGTLRTKNPGPLGEEVTPFPAELKFGDAGRTPPHSQTLHVPVSPSYASIPQSAIEPSRSKHHPIPSPPASAGPGLKGFIMSRFKGRQRPAESSTTSSQISSPSTTTLPMARTQSPEYDSGSAQGQDSRSYQATSPTPFSPTASNPPPSPPQQPTTSHGAGSSISSIPGSGDDVQALQQLFEAASHFGLDQEAVNDLLRKNSTTSKGTTLSRNNTVTSMRPSASRSQSPQVTREAPSPVPSSSAVRALSLKKRAEPMSRPARDAAEASAIVRRTIVIPSGDNARMSTLDFSSLMRKASSKSRRRSSVQSDRSIPRSPTPPIPSPTTARRFSRDVGTPPVPHLPSQSSGHTSALLQVPRPHGTGDGSSPYESLYDMYGEEGKPNVAAPVADGAPGGRAIEVIELANGDTIWSIVNGLRDDDVDSYYGGGRNSFASDYSARDGNANYQVLVKEHNRAGSQGSTASSVVTPKKTALRPETKVFYSSPTEIGRLIENLSEDMNAGSFKFLPSNGHSNVSSFSDVHWTVEERLDHMLGNMSRHR